MYYLPTTWFSYYHFVITKPKLELTTVQMDVWWQKPTGFLIFFWFLSRIVGKGPINWRKDTYSSKTHRCYNSFTLALNTITYIHYWKNELTSVILRLDSPILCMDVFLILLIAKEKKCLSEHHHYKIKLLGQFGKEDAYIFIYS